MNEREAAALERVRLYIEAWIGEYGEKGFIPRLGNVPSLAIADLKLVFEKAEGEHRWAIGSPFSLAEDEEVFYDVVQTFASEKAAVEAAGKAGLVPLWWDDNGYKSRWLGLV